MGFDKGVGDDEFLSTLRYHLPRIIEEQNPGRWVGPSCHSKPYPPFSPGISSPHTHFSSPPPWPPDIILYDAGVDPHESDSLGHLRLTDQGLRERDRYVITTAVTSGVPIACVIGGQSVSRGSTPVVDGPQLRAPRQRRPYLQW